MSIWVAALAFALVGCLILIGFAASTNTRLRVKLDEAKRAEALAQGAQRRALRELETVQATSTNRASELLELKLQLRRTFAVASLRITDRELQLATAPENVVQQMRWDVTSQLMEQVRSAVQVREWVEPDRMTNVIEARLRFSDLIRDTQESA